MNLIQQKLREGADGLGVEYDVIENLCTIIQGRYRKYYFRHGNLSINSSDIRQICKDKMLFYKIFNKVIHMPATRSYLDPNFEIKPGFKHDFKNLDELIDEVEYQSVYPTIIKKNSGSMGMHVYKVTNRKELENAVKQVFNQEDHYYDYLLLNQEYIDIEKEYRVIYLDKKLMFAYLKDNSEAEYADNLSPLHWEGAEAVILEDEEMLKKITKFLDPLNQKLDARLIGYDIAIDSDDEFHFLEANNNPAFGKFLRDNPQSDEFKKFIQIFIKSL